MRRWNCDTGNHTENKDVDNFLKDLVDLCKKHNLSLSHEDSHGAFIVENYSEENVKWLQDSLDNTKRGTDE